MNISDWLPPLIIGLIFTSLGIAKFYGLAKGIIGGAKMPLSQKLCAT